MFSLIFLTNPIFMFHYISRTVHLILMNDGSKNSFSPMSVIGYNFYFNIYTLKKKFNSRFQKKKGDDLRITSLHFGYAPIVWTDFKKMNIQLVIRSLNVRQKL